MAANPKKSYIDPEEELLAAQAAAKAKPAPSTAMQMVGGALRGLGQPGLANIALVASNPESRDAMAKSAKETLVGSGPLGLAGGVDAGTRALYGGAPKAPDYGAMAEADLAPKPAAPAAFQGMGDIRRDESAMPQNKSVSLGGARSRITSVDEDLIHQMQVLDAQRNPQNRAALEAAFGTRGDLVAGRVAARSGMRDIQRAQGGDEAAANRVLTGEEDYLQRSEANRELNREQARLAVNTTKAQAAAAGAAGDPAVLEAKTSAEKSRAQAEAARAAEEEATARAASEAKKVEARGLAASAPLADNAFNTEIDSAAAMIQGGVPLTGVGPGIEKLRATTDQIKKYIAQLPPEQQATVKRNVQRRLGLPVSRDIIRGRLSPGREQWYGTIEELASFLGA